MAKADFCFTYYDGDAARDKAHMNRLERGAYDDLISAQRKFGHLTRQLIQKILSSDFDTCWGALEIVLKKDKQGKFYIEWLENSIIKSAQHSKKQSDTAKSRWEKERNAKNDSGSAAALPLEDGDVNGDEDVNGFKEEIKEDHRYVRAIRDTCLNITTLPQQLSNAEAEKLEIKYGDAVIQEIFDDMENYKDLKKKYQSVYLTAISWIRLREKKQKNGTYQKTGNSSIVTSPNF